MMRIVLVNWPGSFLAVLLALLVTTAQASEDRRVWDGIPVAIDLKVGQERRVVFPVDIDVEIDGRIVPSLRTQIIGNTIYWTPSAPFDSSRIIVSALSGPEIYLLDLAAKNQSVPTDPVVIYPSKQYPGRQYPGTKPETTDGNPANALNPIPGPAARPGYVTLVRWMARALYAPERLRLPPPSGITRTAIESAPINLIRGHHIEATPIIAWRGNGLYLTAVKLTNRLHEPVELDPRDIRGRWLNRTLQHTRLGPVGSDIDTTVVYLMSRSAFGEALR